MKRMWAGVGVLVCLSLVGCGTSTAGGNASSTQSSSPPTTVGNSSSSSSTGSGSTGQSNAAFVSSVQAQVTAFSKIVNQFNTDRKESAGGTLTNVAFDSDIQTMIPKFESVAINIQKLTNTAPQGYVQPLETLVNCVQDFENGLLDVDAAIRTGDTSKIAQANSYIQKSNDEQIQFINQWKQASGQ